MITKYVTKNSNNCAKCACIRNTNVNVCFFPMYSIIMQVKLVNILTNVPIKYSRSDLLYLVPILSYKYVITIP